MKVKDVIVCDKCKTNREFIVESDNTILVCQGCGDRYARMTCEHCGIINDFKLMSDFDGNWKCSQCHHDNRLKLNNTTIFAESARVSGKGFHKKTLNLCFINVIIAIVIMTYNALFNNYVADFRLAINSLGASSAILLACYIGLRINIARLKKSMSTRTFKTFDGIRLSGFKMLFLVLLTFVAIPISPLKDETTVVEFNGDVITQDEILYINSIVKRDDMESVLKIEDSYFITFSDGTHQLVEVEK